MVKLFRVKQWLKVRPLLVRLEYYFSIAKSHVKGSEKDARNEIHAELFKILNLESASEADEELEKAQISVERAIESQLRALERRRVTPTVLIVDSD